MLLNILLSYKNTTWYIRKVVFFMKKTKLYEITFKSRYYPLEGNRKIRRYAESKAAIRLMWHDIINTDEYRIVKIEEVK